jgi:hypothetical protein
MTQAEYCKQNARLSLQRPNWPPGGQHSLAEEPIQTTEEKAWHHRCRLFPLHLKMSTLLYLVQPPPPLIQTTNRVNHKVDRVGIFKQSVGDRNRVGIGLSYRSAKLHRLAELIPGNQFLGSLKISKFGLRVLSFYCCRPNWDSPPPLPPA